MNQNEVTEKTVNPANEAEEKNPAEQPAEDEFKLTIKKLEMPVRPRGVLAE